MSHHQNRAASILLRLADMVQKGAVAEELRQFATAYLDDQSRLADIVTAHVGLMVLLFKAIVDERLGMITSPEEKTELETLAMDILRDMRVIMKQAASQPAHRKPLQVLIILAFLILVGVVSNSILFVVILVWR